MQLTKNQSKVFDALLKAEKPLGAYSLLDRVRKHGFKAPLQVYRALDQLLELGLVHRLESINAWTACCNSHHKETPIFSICDECGIVTEFLDKQLASSIGSLSARNNFTPNHAIIEIHGRCDKCLVGQH